MLAERPLDRALVGPGEGDVPDVVPVPLVQRARPRADHEKELLVGRQQLRHLRDGPAPPPVRTGGVVGVVRQQVDRYAHGISPSCWWDAAAWLMSLHRPFVIVLE